MNMKKMGCEVMYENEGKEEIVGVEGGCDIKSVKEGFVLVSGCVLISDSMVYDQVKARKGSCVRFFN